MHKAIFTGVFWLAIGLFLSICSSNYEIGSLLQPGPGSYPLLLGLLLIALSLKLLLSDRLQKHSSDKENTTPPSTSAGWKRVLVIVLILIVAVFCFETIGYLLTFFFMVMFLMISARSKNWRQILLTSFLSALGVYLVFVLLLKQPLPIGLLGF
jgi:putative tricarboxylic transport membrane protein